MNIINNKREQMFKVLFLGLDIENTFLWPRTITSLATSSFLAILVFIQTLEYLTYLQFVTIVSIAVYE